MPARKLIVATALLSVAVAIVQAGFVSALSEPATVTLVFIALATIGFVGNRKRDTSLDA